MLINTFFIYIFFQSIYISKEKNLRQMFADMPISTAQIEPTFELPVDIKNSV